MALAGRHAVPWLRNLVVSLPRRRPGFDPRQIWFFSKHTGSPVSTIPLCSLSTRCYFRKENGRSLRTVTQNGAVSFIGKHRTRKCCDFTVPGVTVVNVQLSGYLFPTFRRNVRGPYPLEAGLVRNVGNTVFFDR